uniref:Histone deacetylase n=2 Tax=Photinus pyralis TaxID=7054 RepID=A0A1Y1M2X5_PHOPY
MEKKVIYIYDSTLRDECDRLPTVPGRASIVTDLVNSYELLKFGNVTVVPSIPATYDELRLFHSSAYLDFMKAYKEDDVGFEDGEEDEFGLSYDCPLLPRLYTLVQALAGGSITAANLLAERKCDFAINWFGGWHHAQRDEAEGFCYVNDIVIAIQTLTRSFTKILYVDLDVHHGNGVQNAFELSPKILTLSFHKYSPGFYPGGGNVDEVGSRRGKYFSLNVPLRDGCSGKTYLRCFKEIFPRVFQAFKPSALVVQCGADCINGDPVGQINITTKDMGECIKDVLNCNVPTLFLGGGGYNPANTARYWTYLTSLITNQPIDNDIPDCSEYFTKYGPTYELHIDEGCQRDFNTDEYINNIISTVTNYCKLIESECKQI